MSWCSIKNSEKYPGKCFWTKNKKPRLKFNPGLALIGFKQLGPVILVLFFGDLRLEMSWK